MAVTRSGQPVSLEPKAFDVLLMLLERRDRLVMKDELLTAVWPDTFVTPNVLTRAVAQLRKALGDDASEARYIETVTKRGYRFMAPVLVDRETAPAPLVPSPLAAQPAPAEIPGAAHVTTDQTPGPRKLTRVWAAAEIWTGIAILMLVAGATAWLVGARGGRDSDGTAAPATSRRLTLRAGNSTMPALSPDAAMVAFASDASGKLEIYLAGTTLGSREVALTQDGGQNMEPAWSPDGKWIAFHSRARGGVWIVPVTGGPATQIAAGGSAPAWSPDSQWIAFTTSQGGMAGQSVLKVVRRDGTAERSLTQLGEPLGGHLRPTWSHSGRFIAFVVTNGNSSDRAWIVPAAGGVPRALPNVGWTGHVAFGAGDRALYLTGGSLQRGSLLRLPLNSTDATPSGAPTELVALTAGFFSGLSVGGEDTVAYGVTTTDGNLWAVDGRSVTPPEEPVPLTHGTIGAAYPVHAPGTARLAFVRSSVGVPNSVWIASADASSPEPLFTEGLSRWPSWTDDGRILVLRMVGTDQPTLWWFDPTSRRATELSNVSAAGMNFPRISPDGQDIAFWKLEPDGAMNTWIQPVKGGMARRITSDREAANYPAWSPDGRHLAIEIKRGEQTHIGVVSRDGGPIEQLTNEAGQSWPHSWMLDGDSIVFAGERQGVWNVFTVSRRTRVIRQLTHFNSSSGFVRYPSASPDGRSVVFARSVDSGGIWTIDRADPRRNSSN